MKYCTHCGAEMLDDAVVCVKCGCAVNEPAKATDNDGTMKLLVKIFMILGCISIGWTLIPLAWCIPMTVSAFRKLDAGEKFSTGFKVCTLIFVSLVAGIIMLCSDDM